MSGQGAACYRATGTHVLVVLQGVVSWRCSGRAEVGGEPGQGERKGGQQEKGRCSAGLQGAGRQVGRSRGKHLVHGGLHWPDWAEEYGTEGDLSKSCCVLDLASGAGTSHPALPPSLSECGMLISGRLWFLLWVVVRW